MVKRGMLFPRLWENNGSIAMLPTNKKQKTEPSDTEVGTFFANVSEQESFMNSNGDAQDVERGSNLIRILAALRKKDLCSRENLAAISAYSMKNRLIPIMSEVCEFENFNQDLFDKLLRYRDLQSLYCCIFPGELLQLRRQELGDDLINTFITSEDMSGVDKKVGLDWDMVLEYMMGALLSLISMDVCNVDYIARVFKHSGVLQVIDIMNGLEFACHKPERGDIFNRALLDELLAHRDIDSVYKAYTVGWDMDANQTLCYIRHSHIELVRDLYDQFPENFSPDVVHAIMDDTKTQYIKNIFDLIGQYSNNVKEKGEHIQEISEKICSIDLSHLEKLSQLLGELSSQGADFSIGTINKFVVLNESGIDKKLLKVSLKCEVKGDVATVDQGLGGSQSEYGRLFNVHPGDGDEESQGPVGQSVEDLKP